MYQDMVKTRWTDMAANYLTLIHSYKTLKETRFKHTDLQLT